MEQIHYTRNPPITNEALNGLFEAAWQSHQSRDSSPILGRSLVYIGAFYGDRLVGFVNVAWDGGVHGFVLDTTVHPEFQRQGVGLGLLRHAAEVGRERGLEWFHVDYEPRLEAFYNAAGYRPTAAGLLRLTGAAAR